MKILLPTFCILGFFIFTSCDNRRIFEDNVQINKSDWYSNKGLVFEFDVTNQTPLCNMYINIRNNASYRYSNLFLFLDTRYPDGKVSRDTLECILADDSGNWLGKGKGDVIDNQIPFKKNFRFKQQGRYKFYIQQAMRVNPLPGIQATGIRIEKSL